ncbi:MAG: transcription termination factor NusA [Patescibacteria group bacterium]|jgi:N utilization substance protein A|nr:transcription termination factor NusA [Patescibacteria group bacterium]
MSEISSAIKMLCEEKGLEYNLVIEAVETALAAAYRKDYGEKNQNIKVKFNPDTGETKVYDVKNIVDNLSAEEEEEMLNNLQNPEAAHKKQKEEEEKKREEKEKKEEKGEKSEEEGEEEEKKKFNPKTDIQLKEALIFKHDAKVGDELMLDLPIPESYGRMAAQTAKQVIIQKIREMERDMILSEFKDKENEVVSGVVQRREGRLVFVDLGKTIGLLPAEEQIYTERYNPNDRYKFFIKEVREGHKGPEVILSRRSEEILKKVFYLEIPEISNGLVEIKAVAREAGSRSKVAIWTEEENIDPVGSCVGQRGSRVQTIISELGGEKIDIIEFDEDPVKFIANALSPAKAISIDLDEEEHKASVKVASDKLSLAIGKSGQNVRLAARLTGWKIDIIEENEEGEEKKIIGSEEDGNLIVDKTKEEDEEEEVKEENNDEATEEKKGEVKEEKEEDKKEEVEEDEEDDKEDDKEDEENSVDEEEEENTEEEDKKKVEKEKK